MKIEIYEGCLTGGVVIDGKPVEKISKKELAKLEKCVINKIPRLLKESGQPIFQLLATLEPNFEDCESEPCEMCGDTVVKKTYIL